MNAPPSVRPERSRRARKTLSAHELVRFLDLLSETGNFALACERLGRSKSALYKRRIRDSLFDCECHAALALFRSSPGSPGGGGPPKTVEGRVTLTTYAGRPQLRRARPGMIARGSLHDFLRTLAATGNVRFAAKSIGVAASSIHARRRRDPAFAAEIEAALDVAHASLEMNLVEASGAFSDWFLDPPRNGEGDHLEGGGRADPAHPELSESEMTAGQGFATRMTVSQAINLLGRLQKRVEREGS